MMKMNKLIVCYLAGNTESFVDVSLKSVYDTADHIVIVYDTTSKDNTYKKIMEWQKKNVDKITILERPYEHDKNVKNANSNARNFYLKFLKTHFFNDYCLVLDMDEVVDEHFKNFKNSKYLDGYDVVCNVHMRHLIKDLQTEDATSKKHYVNNRFFKITNNLYYPKGEHPVLHSPRPSSTIDFFTIWHLGYCRYPFYIKERYDTHMSKSLIHNKIFLKNWSRSHYFGTYPNKKFNPAELPKVLLEHFNIDKDEFYFINRNIEIKHYDDAIAIKKMLNPKNVICLGAGRGPRVYALNVLGMNTVGVELSKWACNNPVRDGVHLIQGDVSEKLNVQPVELVISYDLFEHLSKEQLNMALNNCYNLTSKHLLVSVPVLGDPNLLLDKTHIIKESRVWWEAQIIAKGFKLISTPKDFPFAKQIMIFEKVNP